MTGGTAHVSLRLLFDVHSEWIGEAPFECANKRREAEVLLHIQTGAEGYCMTP